MCFVSVCVTQGFFVTKQVLVQTIESFQTFSVEIFFRHPIYKKKLMTFFLLIGYALKKFFIDTSKKVPVDLRK